MLSNVNGNPQKKSETAIPKNINTKHSNIHGAVVCVLFRYLPSIKNLKNLTKADFSFAPSNSFRELYRTKRPLWKLLDDGSCCSPTRWRAILEIIAAHRAACRVIYITSGARVFWTDDQSLLIAAKKSAGRLLPSVLAPSLPRRDQTRHRHRRIRQRSSTYGR
jgi:hypothetical protein